MRFRRLMLAGLLMVPAVAGTASGARAALLDWAIDQAYPYSSVDVGLPGADFAIACDNGGNYRLSSGPAVLPGDIATAHLYLSPNRAVPVRLMPMGVGYRYAGRGVWLDGVRDHALLYLSKYHPLACTVSRV